MIWFSDKSIMVDDEYISDSAIYFDDEDKARLLNVLKRGVNTLSPSDPEIVKLIGEMEK